jgi:hypothetical protein
MDPDDQLITNPDPDPTTIFLSPLKRKLMSGSISLKLCNFEFFRKFLRTFDKIEPVRIRIRASVIQNYGSTNPDPGQFITDPPDP